jgi:hypothetical protein
MNDTCTFCADETRNVIATDGDNKLCFGCFAAYKRGYELGLMTGYDNGMRDERIISKVRQ